MNWTGVADFVAMGGYGRYVWGAYGVTAICMLVDPIAAMRRHRRALKTSTDDAPDDSGTDGANEPARRGSDRHHEVAA